MIGETDALDHVIVASDDPDSDVAAFRTLGLEPRYGGVHANGVTEMHLVTGADGSYLEILSKVDPGKTAPKWDAFLDSGVGPCAYVVSVDDVERHIDRLTERGVHVTGPVRSGRTLNDGTELSWKMAFPGPGEPGTLLPVLLEDETPRDRRVGPVADRSYSRMEFVAIGVDSLAEVVDRVRDALGSEVVDRGVDQQLSVDLVRFEDLPIVLATPTSDDTWLSERLDRFGTLPFACVLSVEGTLGASVGETSEWFEWTIDWPVRPRVGDYSIGVLRG